MREQEFIGQRPRQGIRREENQSLVGPSQRFLVQRKKWIEERKEAAAACKQDYCASQVVALNSCCAYF